MIICVIIILRKHYFIIFKLIRPIKFFILNQIKQTALKSGYNFTTYANSWTLAEFKNCKLENRSLLFGHLAQHLGSDK